MKKNVIILSVLFSSVFCLQGEQFDPNSVLSVSICGNRMLELNEDCDEGGVQTATCEQTCTIPVCGDGILNPLVGEECEDGNIASGDGCSASCKSEITASQCGNGILETGETCDEGGVQTATCEANCSAPVCGDTVLNTFSGETCDEGGVQTATCEANCLAPVCGDSVLNTLSGETCDEGGVQTATCEADCSAPVCGDSVLNTFSGETCDEGGVQTATCEADCSAPVCGDSVLNTFSGETCDEGGVQTATCEANCSAPVCGDSVLNTFSGETCDEGGVQTATCEADCSAPVCGDSVLNILSGETCDNGVSNNDLISDACRTNCALPFCGDGVIDTGEACDGDGAGNGGETALCDTDCTAQVCGDGIINTTAGETCDDSGESATCDTDCTVQLCGDGLINATAGETCDDSGESAACDTDCTAQLCGDGIINVTAGETCDDSGESAACDTDCTAQLCGDGIINVTAGETCDDSGESAACDTDCTVQVCGDGLINATAGETCDDSGESAACDTDCTAQVCGDGIINVTAGEVCDDSGESAACDTDCTAQVCGDGIINTSAGEVCDNGGTNNDFIADACRTTCVLPSCGDSVVDSGEECDDGNIVAGDGCSSICVYESFGIDLAVTNVTYTDQNGGNVEPGDTLLVSAVITNLGNANAPVDSFAVGIVKASAQNFQPLDYDVFAEPSINAFSTDNTTILNISYIVPLIYTGDMKIFAAAGIDLSDTDFSNNINYSTVQFNLPAICGDGFTDAAGGEECDDGDLIAGDGCDASCLLEIPSPLLNVVSDLATVDVSISESVTFTVTTDAAANIQSANIYTVSPTGEEGWYWLSNEGGGVFMTTSDIPNTPFVENGIYQIKIRLTDANNKDFLYEANTSTGFYDYEYNYLGWKKQTLISNVPFEVINATTDINPPVISNIQIDTTACTGATGCVDGDSVTVIIWATDDVTGIEWADVQLMDDNFNFYGWGSFSYDFINAYYTADITLNGDPFTAAVLHPQIYIADGLWNYAYYRKTPASGTEFTVEEESTTYLSLIPLAPVDFEAVVSTCGDNFVDFAGGEQCDDGNTTPGDNCDDFCQLETAMPLVSITTDVTTVDASIPESVIVTITTDNVLTNVTSGSIGIKSPLGSTNWYSLTDTGGGVLTAAIVANQYGENGVFEIYYISLYDSLSGYYHYYNDDNSWGAYDYNPGYNWNWGIRPTGFTTATYEVINASTDFDPPVVTDIQVDTSACTGAVGCYRGETVTVNVWASDAISGISNINVSLYDTDWYFYGSVTLTFDGIKYTGNIVISASNPLKTASMYPRVYTYDVSGNWARHQYSNLTYLYYGYRDNLILSETVSSIILPWVELEATSSTCGDSYVDFTGGEQCDDGNITPGDDCDDFCQLEILNPLLSVTTDVTDVDASLGETVTVTIATDTGMPNVMSGYIYTKSPEGIIKSHTLSIGGGGMLTAAITPYLYGENGVFEVYYVALYDNNAVYHYYQDNYSTGVYDYRPGYNSNWGIKPTAVNTGSYNVINALYDTQPPVISDIQFDISACTGSSNTCITGDVVTINIWAVDDLSGINNVYVDLADSLWWFWYGGASLTFDGTKYTVDITLSGDIFQEDFVFPYVYINDNASNNDYYRYDSFSTSFFTYDSFSVSTIPLTWFEKQAMAWPPAVDGTLAVNSGYSAPYTFFTTTDVYWLSFSVTSGNMYTVYWDDGMCGSATYTAELSVSVYDAASPPNTIFNQWGCGFGGYSFMATSTGTAYIQAAAPWIIGDAVFQVTSP